MAIEFSESAWAEKGSQLQLQLFVNRRAAELNSAIVEATPELSGTRPEITWVSPIEEDGFAEYLDADFLARVELPGLKDELEHFWPRSGPRWDGLAQVRDGERSGVLLVEAKAHAGEIGASPCKAGPASRERIAQALAWTRGILGVPLDTEVWLGPNYQLANRIAHAVWLRQLSVEAWLAVVGFAEDQTNRPATAVELEAAMEVAFSDLGLDGSEIPFVGTPILRAADPSELAPTA